MGVVTGFLVTTGPRWRDMGQSHGGDTSPDPDGNWDMEGGTLGRTGRDWGRERWGYGRTGRD